MKAVSKLDADKRLLGDREIVVAVSARREVPDDPFERELARIQSGCEIVPFEFKEYWHVGHQSFNPYRSSFRRLDINAAPTEDLNQADGTPAIHLEVFV